MDANHLLDILRKSKTKYKHVLEAKNNELEELHSLMLEDEYYPHIHITGYSGLVADPGGLVYFNGRYFLHYLWSPFHWIHGLKHWCLVSTKDFVNFTQHGVSIMPSTKDDQYGIYSGCAAYRNNKEGAELFFTANVKKLGQTDDERKSVITRVFQDENGKTSSFKEALWTFDMNKYTPHFRDPKLFFHNKEWYFIVGAQKKNKEGNLAIFQEKGYKWIGDLQFENNLERGYMIERPEIIQEGNKTVIIGSPEGVEVLKGSERVTAYTVGNLNKEFVLENNTKWCPLDFGHDFYVPSICKDNKGRNISIGWFGISRVECHPTSKNMWSHAMAIPRVVVLKGDHLYQNPVEEMKDLRNRKLEVIKNSISISNKEAFEITFENRPNTNFQISLTNKKGDSVLMSFNKNTFVLNREMMSLPYYPELGNTRSINNIKLTNLQLFIDASFLEIYINLGEYVMSSRIFIENLNEINWSGINFISGFGLNPINVNWKNVLTNFKKPKVDFELPYTHK